MQTTTIERTDNNQLELGRFRSLQLRLADITDATWSNLGILVAGKAAEGENQARPWQVNVDGSYQRALPGASSEFDAIHVAANPNLDTLPAVQDAAGQLHWQGKDLNWVDLAEGAEGKVSPVYPG